MNDLNCLMKKTVLILLIFRFSFAADWIKIGSLAFHSDYLYRGESATRHQPAIAPELTFMHSRAPLFLDVWFLSSTGRDPYSQLDFMLSGDVFQTENTVLSLTAIGKAAELYTQAIYTFEMQASLTVFASIPIMAEISQEFLEKSSYLQLQTAYDFDYKLPWTLGLLAGYNLLKNRSDTDGLAGFSLSTWLKMGRLSIEPYSVLQLSFQINERATLRGSLSVTLGYEL